jgi:hypothetical protein
LASGVWSLDSQFDSQSSSIWPLAFPQTTFANSARWNRADSPYLSKTFSSAGNRDKWTFSCWVKKCKTGVEQRLLTTSDNSSFDDNIRFNSDDTFNVICNNATVLTTNRVFRDTSAFYYISVVWDSGNSTSGDRCKLFVNGVRETSFSTESYPSQNQDSYINNNTAHYIGVTNATANSNHLDGYLTEVIFVDDQALDATSFGAFNPITNIWEPIAYAGTYGTNGFRFDFANSAELGTDVSGNSNTFSETNLATTDQSTDTCSNNFATWNPLDNYYGEGTTSEGNIRYTTGSTNQAPIPATIGVSNGKWYWEVKFVSDTGGYAMIGIASSQTTANNELGHNSTDYAYVSGTGQYRNNDGYTSYGNTYTTGDIIGIALDLDNNKLYFSKNGTFQNSGDPTSGSTGTGAISITAPTSTPYGNYFPALSDFGSNTVVFDGNFGSPSFSISSGNADANGHGNFEYSVPSGYFALCTKNLAEFGG